MANIFPAQAKVTPSFSEPDLIVTYAQPSGFPALLENNAPRVKLSTDDLWVYVNRLDIRTDATASQFGPSWIPSASLTAEFHQTQTYKIKVRVAYDDDMMAAASRYNVSLPHAQELAMRQGINNQLRNMCIYGYNAANNEGLLNTQGATTTNLPADVYGNTTVQTYDPNSMYQFMLSQIELLVARMYQSNGGKMGNRIVILSPQQEFLRFQLSQIVQVTSYQRPGGGTDSVAGAIQKVAADAGYRLEWWYDDTLIGKGAGGNDLVIMTVPEVKIPDIEFGVNTNIFGEMSPATKATNVMYMDAAAPIKMSTPIPDGGITETLSLRATSGWCWRPEGITIVSMPY